MDGPKKIAKFSNLPYPQYVLFQITLTPSKFCRGQGETKNEQNCSLLGVGIKGGSRSDNGCVLAICCYFVDGRTDGWTCGWMDRWTNVLLDGQTDGLTDRRLDGRTDGRTDPRVEMRKLT